MIPIKIQCGCGQKYAFEVEPANRGMSCTVHCPACGADGTPAANLAISRHFTAPAKLSPAAPRAKWVVPVLSGTVGLALLLLGIVCVVRGRAQTSKPSATPVVATFPRSPAEINAWYAEPPAGQNAAIVFAQGFAALQIANPSPAQLPLLGKGVMPPLGAALSSNAKSAVTALLRANRDALQFFAQGTRIESSRYPVDLTAGFEAVLPHLGKFKSSALLLELSAILHGEANEGKLAAVDVLSGLALARSLENEPNLFSQSVRVATISIAVSSWEQTVNRTAIPAESLSELMQAFKRMEVYEASGEGFQRGLVAERATWMALLAAPQKFSQALALPGVDIPATDRDRISARLEKGGKLKDEQAFLERTFEQLAAARQVPFPARLKADEVIEKRSSAARNQKLVLLGVVLPAFAGRSAKEAESLARLRLGMTAVALEQFRAAHGSQYPKELAQLIPDFLPCAATDPFDGEPLRYHGSGKGYLLYSVGPDLEDNSGARIDAKKGDLVFAVVNRK